MKRVQWVSAGFGLILGCPGLAGTAWAVTPQAAEQAATAPAVAVTTDIEATMKQMGYTFKQAMQAADVASMHQQVNALTDLVASAQLYQFTPQKQQVFQQGLAKVAAQLSLVQAQLAKNDLAGAKQALAEVDSLKKQYHKERSPSLWQLIFGS